MGILEDGSLVEKDPKLCFVLDDGDVIQVRIRRMSLKGENIYFVVEKYLCVIMVNLQNFLYLITKEPGSGWDILGIKVNTHDKNIINLHCNEV